MKPTIAIPTEMLRNEKTSASFLKNVPDLARYSLSENMDGKRDTEYRIELITKEDEPAVIKFLRRFFFRDEPLNHCIQLIPEGEDSTCAELEEYSTAAFADNLSLKAVSTSGAIIGVCLNGIMEPPKETEPDYVKYCKHPKFKKIVRLLYHVDKNANVAAKYPGKKVLELRIISVDSRWRGKGVAKCLFETSMELAEQQGFDLFRTDCSSAFTGKLCEKFGMTPIYELKYAEYLDGDGNPIFSPQSPHTEVRTYVRMLK